MNKIILAPALLLALSLAACDKPTIVNTPPTPVVVPGPAGPQGADGAKGEAGKPGDGVTVNVMPAASAASN